MSGSKIRGVSASRMTKREVIRALQDIAPSDIMRGVILDLSGNNRALLRYAKGVLESADGRLSDEQVSTLNECVATLMAIVVDEAREAKERVVAKVTKAKPTKPVKKVKKAKKKASKAKGTSKAKTAATKATKTGKKSAPRRRK